MIIEEIKYNMALTEKITQALGDKISQCDYYIEDNLISVLTLLF